MATQTYLRTPMVESGEMTPIRATTRPVSTGQIAAILLMLGGWGWNNGQFVQPVVYGWGQLADALHLVPVVALLLLGIVYFRRPEAPARGVLIGFTIIAVITIIGCAVMLVLGLTNPDPNSVGIHTFEDAMPAIMMNAGTLLWLVTLPFGRRSVTRSAAS